MSIPHEHTRANFKPPDTDDIKGKNPLSLSIKQLSSAGHEPMPIGKVIRKKCLDCCNYQLAEVRKCVITDCPLWPYRMGKNPFRSAACKANPTYFKKEETHD